MNIKEVLPQENYMLLIVTDDGQKGLFDVSPYMASEAFAPLKDKDEFNNVRSGSYFVEWACGADLSADTISARWQPIITT